MPLEAQEAQACFVNASPPTLVDLSDHFANASVSSTKKRVSVHTFTMRSKASSECNAEQSERLQDQIIEEIKEMEHNRTEEALNLVRKETDLWRYQHVKEEAKKMQGARKLRKDEDMAWVLPRNMSK